MTEQQDWDDPEIGASWAQRPQFYAAPTPKDMHPMPFQLAGVEYALRRRNAIIGDQPGLGKTAQAIMLSNAIGARNCLVVCPASLRLNWEKEIWKWSTIENVETYPVLKSSDGTSPDANYVILSYDLLRNPSILNGIMDYTWDHLILDEAHYLKDPKGNKRTQVICAPNLLPSVVGRITLLSGTIMPNQPIECYNAMRLVDWDSIDRMSQESFREHYYAKGGGMVTGRYLTNVINKKTGFEEPVWKVGPHWSNNVRNQPRRLDELRWRLRKHCMVRRLKQDVLPQLPPKTWHVFPLAQTAAVRKAMKHPGWKQASQLYEMDPHAFDRGVPIDGAIAEARRLLGEAKAPSVADYIEDLLQEGTEPLVIAAWHHSVLDYLRERLGKYGLVYMDGNTSSRKKQQAVDQFQEREDVKIILGQMLPLGEGWTLTRSTNIVFAEFDWVPGKNDQMFDRINRLGQEANHTIGHVPVVPGTLDERILGSAIEKDTHIHEALDAR